MGHPKRGSFRNKFHVLDNCLVIITRISVAPNVRVHEKVRLEKVELNGLTDPPIFAEPYPKQFVGAMYKFLRIEVKLLLPKVQRRLKVSATYSCNGHVLQRHFDNDRGIERVGPIGSNRLDETAFSKDDKWILRTEHVGHPLNILVR